MPYKPAGPCSYPGCPDRAVIRGRCAKHQVIIRKPDERQGSTARGYGYAWQVLRQEHLTASPYCVMCGAVGQHVDHIIPKARGGTDDAANLQTLCHSCHSRKTVRHDGGFGVRRDKR